MALVSRYCCKCCATTTQSEVKKERICTKCGTVTSTKDKSPSRPTPRLYTST